MQAENYLLKIQFYFKISAYSESENPLVIVIFVKIILKTWKACWKKTFRFKIVADLEKKVS